MHDMQGDYQSEIIKKTRNDVLFTIDDGPGKYTSKIAKTLDSLEYEGIFFVIGKEITEKNKYMLIEAAKMWHKIWNHSFSHPNFARLDMQSAKEEILRTDSLINEILCEAGVDQKQKYIRYPYGNQPPASYREEFNDFLDSLWYTEPSMYRRMDTDLKDWRSKPIDQKIDKIKENDTILLHEKSRTPEVINKIVQNLDNKKEH